MLFDIAIDERDGWTVLSVVGELDLATAPKLRQQLVSVTNRGQSFIVIDLSSTDFIDSTGLGVIIGAMRRVRQAGGEAAVVITVRRVRDLFAVTRLDQILAIGETVELAVAAVAAGSGVLPPGRDGTASIGDAERGADG